MKWRFRIAESFSSSIQDDGHGGNLLVIDVGPKFYWALSTPLGHDLEFKVTDLEIFMLKFCGKVFKIS